MTADQDPSSRKPNSKTGANRKQTPRNKAATEHPRRPKPSTNVSGIEEWVELLCTVKLAKKRACCDAFLGKAGPEATVVSFPWRVDDKKDLTCLEKEMGLEPAPSHPTPLSSGSICSARASLAKNKSFSQEISEQNGRGSVSRD